MTRQQSPAPPPEPAPEPAQTTAAESYEERHVHSVYESIAPHFSSTRYKPWPLVAGFLRAQPPGAVGLDVGCGNGKYLGVNPDVVVLGSDRSAALVALAREKGREDQDRDRGGAAAAASEAVAVADGLALPFRVGGGGGSGGGDRGTRRGAGVDFVICVAVVHHLSTRERRVEAVRALLECLREDGRALVYVWALEQGSSRRGWDEGADQDQLVPWVMRTSNKANKPRAKKKRKDDDGDGGGDQEPTTAAAAGDANGDRTYQRYYHLYKKGELEEDVMAAGGTVLDSGYEKDNWWVIAGRKDVLPLPPPPPAGSS
ncbi:hypothetical protein DL766_003008 [Monosporascus sp. MC13-8B]|uniref:Methyltransferase type 11 domain-containing protein n=1 Tax=Monosporascus cannonballus TaxID=155416 RepID=A0ABY0GW42_9PEZI|nr:hypothetical protein DL762_008433 [Monosporascus cannonballus]RYO81194.1 hypothetical protein DL763_008640 [Monosporascus cannonballus]RYP34359.1 hypothetical protein DL766_003008 [Monosporascus sp. MC13-8B]